MGAKTKNLHLYNFGHIYIYMSLFKGRASRKKMNKALQFLRLDSGCLFLDVILTRSQLSTSGKAVG